MITRGFVVTATHHIARRFGGRARLTSDDAWMTLRPTLAATDRPWVLTLEAAFEPANANGKLYVDRGAGFSETDVLALLARSDGGFMAVVAEPAGVRALRWDPDDHAGTTMRVKSIELREATPAETRLVQLLRPMAGAAGSPDDPTRVLIDARVPEIADDRDPERILFLRGLIERRSPTITPLGIERWRGPAGTGLHAVVLALSTARTLAFPIFDHAWYARQAGLPADSHPLDALADYLGRGEVLGLSPNPFFRPDRFVRAHDHVARAHRDRPDWSILEHAITMDGAGAVAACFFDSGGYDAQVPNRGGLGSIAHYVAGGWRTARPNGLFDEAWYLANAPDARAAVERGDYPNAFSHFVMNDAAGVPYVSPFFDPAAYLDINRDVGDPRIPDDLALSFDHYLRYGRAERRIADRSGLSVALARHFPAGLPDARPEGSDANGPSPRDALLSLRSDTPLAGAIGDALWRFGAPHLELHPQQQRAIVFAGVPTRVYVDGIASWPHATLAEIGTDSDLVTAARFFLHPRMSSLETAALLGGSMADLQTGFLLCLDVRADQLPPGETLVSLAFTFERGGERRTVPGPTVTVAVVAAPSRSAATADIQVLMASFNPQRSQFEKQIDTIFAGPDPITLLVSDDASTGDGLAHVAAASRRSHVEVRGQTVNMGFVANFERALMARSAAAETLLLSDQDDCWHPDKVGTLRRHLRDEDAILAYSDMRIVDEDGEIVSPSFWRGRIPHHADPVSLAVANAVTGAASAFRAELAQHLLPLPRFHGIYHDHWLAVIAATAGRIAYVPRPLYDYVQHGGNVLGFAGSSDGRPEQGRATRIRLHRLRRAVRSGRMLDRREASTFAEILDTLTIPTLERFVLVTEALRRLADWHDPLSRHVAAQACAIVEGRRVDVVDLKRAWRRLKRQAGGARALLGIDDRIEATIVAMILLRTHAGLFDQLAQAADRDRQASQAHGRRLKAAGGYGLPWRLASLPVELVEAGERTRLRVNLFVSELDPSTLLGAPYTVLALGHRLMERGCDIRIIQLDRWRVDYNAVADIGGLFPELIPLLDRAEFVAASGRHETVPFMLRDALLATSSWTAHVADGVRQALAQQRFAYLIQDFEPFAVPRGTSYRMAESSYALPHAAVYSTEILRRHFEAEGLSPIVTPEADSISFTFEPPIVATDGRRRSVSRARQLLLHAGPGSRGPDAMSDLAIEALRRAAERIGHELDGWRLLGFGSDAPQTIDLGQGRSLTIAGRLSRERYRQLLAISDIGLALSDAPHPGVVPIEMAAAGLWTITNSCLTKTPEAMAEISVDVIVSAPDIGCIADAIVRAVRRTNDGQHPAGRVSWPTNPAESFPDEWIDRLIATMEDAIRRPRAG